MSPDTLSTPPADDIASLLTSARALRDALARALETRPLADAEAAIVRTAADRLNHSVLRPLESLALGVSTVTPHTAGGEPLAEDTINPLDLLRADALWQLTLQATRMSAAPGAVPEVLEATAALQDLVTALVQPDEASQRLATLTEIQSALPESVRSERNGPYLITNLTSFRDWLGNPIPVRPLLALCRCGQSSLKPLCDGSHASSGFSDEKDPRRVLDRRDTYIGQQVTVFDNRGICQHSGFCTDRLNTVFHTDTTPFVTPSGGRMDEIIRAVRDCPSGALSFAVDGSEEREQVDYHSTREPAIEVTKDGPYRVTGGVQLLDHDGASEPRNDGASLEHYALCRCGQSQNKPFCSGMHWYVQFRDPVFSSDYEPTLFEWCGGLPSLTRMTRIFYEKYVPQDPLLAPLFSQMAADHPQRVARWLAEVFGGPKAYSTAYGGYPRMLSQHLGRGLTEEQRARWVTLITQSAHDAGLPNDAEFRSVFGAYLEWGSRLAVENSQAGARPPEHMPMPHWDWNTASGPPWSRVSAVHVAGPEAEPGPSVATPALDEQVSFRRHIAGLFRPMDRRSMQFAFDLWKLEDVRQHGQAIAERLQAGSMPCDGRWPPEKVEVFERWLSSGAAE